MWNEQQIEGQRTTGITSMSGCSRSSQWTKYPRSLLRRSPRLNEHSRTLRAVTRYGGRQSVLCTATTAVILSEESRSGGSVLRKNYSSAFICFALRAIDIVYRSILTHRRSAGMPAQSRATNLPHAKRSGRHKLLKGLQQCLHLFCIKGYRYCV